jgi:endonuclease G
MARSRTKKKKTGKKILLLLLVILILFALLLIFSPPPAPAVTKDSTGWPVDIELPTPVPGQQIIKHTGYTLSYDETHEEASYVAYQLTRDEVNGAVQRGENFRPDPMVTTGSATLEDYRGSGYDRGHLIPAADQKWSEQAMDDSFYMSNMTPQAGSFNRGIWGSLEAMVRTFANDDGAVYVVTGPILTDGPYKTIGSNKVAVPKRFYKVVLYYDGKNAKAIGFILPNAGSNNPVSSFALSVDDVEAATGLDFYPRLSDDIEAKVEATFNLSDWNWKEFTPGDGPKTMVQPAQEDKKSETIKQIVLVMIDELRYQVMVFLKSL